ncbi:MAG: transcription termination factor Rho [Desulfobacterales bacterium]|nr:transcription termination factor Rho [Desulfobacterales bacterium]
MGTEKTEKPLDKMTVKELREVAKEMPEITGVHGMNKADLLDAIIKVQGIEVKPKAQTKVKAKKTDRDAKSLKKAMKAYRQKQAQAASADDKKLAAIYRRKVSRLKKKTRNAA